MTAAPPPHQLSTCPFCRRLLTHSTGATLLLCPSCKRLIPLSHLPPTATCAQTACASCRHIMLHPLGTRLVICPICTAPTPAPLLFYVCRGCGLYLVYSSTLSMVVCAVCGVIHPPILGLTTPRPATPVSVPLHGLTPLQIGVTRPIPRLPPRRVSWLPSTPVRPVVGARPPQMGRAGRRPRPRSVHEAADGDRALQQGIAMEMHAGRPQRPQSVRVQPASMGDRQDGQEEHNSGE